VKTPGLDLYVDMGSISSNGLNVGVEARINNPNLVTLDIGNLQVVAKGETGQTYVQDTISGGSIVPNSSRTFTHSTVIPLDVLSERSMIDTVDTRAGASGITLPVSATITVNIPDLQNLISAPSIVLSVNIGQLSSNGLRTDLQANISNPNPLGLDIGNLQIVMEGQAGDVITTSTMMGGSIAPNSTGTFTNDVMIPLQVLNERSIIVTADTRAGVAGVTLPITATVTVNIPGIQNLITVPQVTIYADPTIVATFPLPSLRILIDTTITNSNTFGLIIGDLHINMFRSDGTPVKQTTMSGGNIQASSSRTFPGSVTLGPEILSLIGSSYLRIKVDSEVGISGINDRIPIGAEFILVLPHLP